MKKFSGLATLGLVGCLEAQEPRIVLDTVPKMVYVDSVVANNVSLLYHFVTRRSGQEFALCLNGDIRGDTVNIRTARLPMIYSTSSDSMSYRPCNQDDDYIGMIHSHPRAAPNENECRMSTVDERRWAGDTRAKMELVLCESFIRFYFKR